MKETEVGKITYGEDVEIVASVVDWGQRHQVHVRVALDGPGFYFHIDVEDPREIGDLFERARMVRKGVLADRYSKMVPTLTEPLQAAIEAVDAILFQRGYDDPYAAGSAARAALAEQIVLTTKDLNQAVSAAMVWVPEAPITPRAFEVGQEVRVKAAFYDGARTIPAGTLGLVTAVSDGAIHLRLRPEGSCWVDPSLIERSEDEADG